MLQCTGNVDALLQWHTLAKRLPCCSRFAHATNTNIIENPPYEIVFEFKFRWGTAMWSADSQHTLTYGYEMEWLKTQVKHQHTHTHTLKTFQHCMWITFILRRFAHILMHFYHLNHDSLLLISCICLLWHHDLQLTITETGTFCDERVNFIRKMTDFHLRDQEKSRISCRRLEKLAWHVTAFL